MLQLPQPIDPTPLLQENLRQRLALMQQPSPWAQAMPAIAQAGSQIIGAGAGLYENAQKQKTLLAARQMAADYLSMTPDERRDPSNQQRVQQGIAASLALGITPPSQQKSAEQMMAEEYAKESAKRKADLAFPAPPKPAKIETPEQKAAQENKDAMAKARLWQQNINNIIPIIAKRGSPLGIAAINNQRKDRLLEIANNPTPTPQEVRMMEADLAGVMQGGSPQEDMLRSTHYGSVAQDWASFKGKLTGTPQDASSPEIVAKLKQIALGIGQVDNKVIADNLHIIEKYPSMTYLIKKDPQGWDNFKQTMMGTLQGQGTTENDSASLLDKYGAP